MATSPADLLLTLLQADGQTVAAAKGSAVDWQSTVGKELDAPDNVVTVYNTAGRVDARLMAGNLVEHYGIQLRVRSKDQPTGWDKIASIEQWLLALTDRQASGYTVHAATGFGSVMDLGDDSPNTKRRLYTLNFNLVVR